MSLKNQHRIWMMLVNLQIQFYHTSQWNHPQRRINLLLPLKLQNSWEKVRNKLKVMYMVLIRNHPVEELKISWNNSSRNNRWRIVYSYQNNIQTFMIRLMLWKVHHSNHLKTTFRNSNLTLLTKLWLNSRQDKMLKQIHYLITIHLNQTNYTKK